MNKRFLLVAALCAAMNVASFAQTNLAEGKTAVASTETVGDPASNAFDGNLDTRWQVDAGNADKECVKQGDGGLPDVDLTVTNGHWIYVNLGEEQDFNLIRIKWEGAYAKKFAIYTANETDEEGNPKWGDTPVFTKDEELKDFTKNYSYNVGNQKARYVKLQALELGFVGNWFSIYEMGVYKNDVAATLTKVTTSTDIVKVGDTFTVSALDQLDQDMEDAEITATNAEKQADGSFKATGEGDIIITAVANGVTVNKTIKAYVPKMTTVTVTPGIVVTGVDRPLTFAVKDQEGKDITGFTTSIEGPTFKAEKDGPQTITLTYGDETKDVTVYAISKAADEPTLSDEDDLSIYSNDITGIGISDKGWNGKYTYYEQMDINGNKVLAVTDAGTFGLQSNTTETGFKSLNFDIFPTTGTEGYITYEGSGLANMTFTVKPGQWNHISLDVTDATAFGNWIQISMGKPGAYAPDNILIDNIYLSKKEVTLAENVNVAAKGDDKGFHAVTGYAKTAAPINEALNDNNITAYDLRNLTVGDEEMTLTPANPNAIILVAGTVEGDIATPKANWGNTKNLVVDNGQGYYFPVNQIQISDKAPVYTDFFISTKSNTGYKITRTLPAKAYTTAFLPKGTTLPEGCKAYEWSADAENGNNIELKETDTFNANTAYVIFNAGENEAELTVEGDGDLDLRAEKEESQQYGNVTVKGNYQFFKGNGTEFGISSQAEEGKLKLQALGEEDIIVPFSAYFTLAEGTSADDVTITIKDTTDGIKGIHTTDAAKASNIYSADGKLVKKNATSTNGLTKGIYVINGKKVVIK